ncbi:MAG: hypothetical protein JRD89_17595 [Deltaproteobacteria bacterium]|nr:hypothetical protein [Deltaproteobacteria bacterium]
MGNISFWSAVKFGAGFSLGGALLSAPIWVLLAVLGLKEVTTVACPACGAEIPVGPPYPAHFACLECGQVIEVGAQNPGLSVRNSGYRYPALPEACVCESCGHVVENPGTHCRVLSCPVCGASMWRKK